MGWRLISVVPCNSVSVASEMYLMRIRSVGSKPFVPSFLDETNGACIKPDTPINVYTRFCLNTAKSKFSLISPVADW